MVRKSRPSLNLFSSAFFLLKKNRLGVGVLVGGVVCASAGGKGGQLGTLSAYPSSSPCVSVKLTSRVLTTVHYTTGVLRASQGNGSRLLTRRGCDGT